MNAIEICLYELTSLLERVGGLASLTLLALVAAATVLLPLRFGAGLLDPLFLTVYTAVAPLLAGNFIARGFASEKARTHIINDGDAPLAVATGKILAAALWGLFTWAVLTAIPLISLNSIARRMMLPPAALMAALALFAFSSSWLASALGSIFAVEAANPRQAQTFVRGIILLPLLIVAVTYTVLGGDARLSLMRLLESPRLPFVLLVLSIGLLVLGQLAVRHTASKIDELRHPLSITE